MDEAHLESGEPGDHIGLDESGVEPLLSDAIAIKNNSIAGLQRETLLGTRFRHQQRCEHNEKTGNHNSVSFIKASFQPTRTFHFDGAPCAIFPISSFDRTLAYT